MDYPDLLSLQVLQQEHPAFTANIDLFKEIDTLYQAGVELEHNKHDYLVSKPGEDSTTFEYRKKIFTYEPILTESLSEFANLFATNSYIMDLPINDFWDSFSYNTDGFGRPEKLLIRNCLIQLLKYRTVFGYVDKKQVSNSFVNNFKTSINSNKEIPYVVLLDPKTVIHWEKEGTSVNWIKFRQIETIHSPVNEPVHIARWVFIDDEKIVVYQTEINKTDNHSQLSPINRNKDSFYGLDDSYNNASMIPKFIEVYHEQPTIPIFCAEIPEETWTSNLAIHLVREHIRIHNNLTFACNIAGVIQRLFKPMRENADDIIDIEEAQNMAQTGNEYVIVGDDFKYVEAGGSSIQVLDDRCDRIATRIKSLIFCNGVGVNRNSPAQESGRAKSYDFVNQEAALKAVGGIIQPWLQNVYRRIAWLYGFKQDDIDKIFIYGMDDFNLDAPDEKLERLVRLSQLALPIPNTAYQLLLLDFIKSLFPSIPPKDFKKLQKELKEIYSTGHPYISQENLMKMYELSLLPPDKVFEYAGFTNTELKSLAQFLKEIKFKELKTVEDNQAASLPKENDLKQN
jgi:hypothetical protein